MNAGVAIALAPAKINLGLDVLGRRADGFHEVDTRLVTVALCDLVHARRTSESGVRIVVRGPASTDDIPCDERNLATRAAALALREARVDGGLALELVKHVPSRAGLGGASSDAAAALIAAQAVLGAVWPSARTRELLATLGSDTVFFGAVRFTGHGHARGRGELVDVLARLPRTALVLVVPDIGCPTADVYRAHAASGVVTRAGAAQPNALEPAAIAAVPELARWRAALDERFVLSGSGSAFFARADSDAAARALAAQVCEHVARLGLTPRLVLNTHTLDHGARLLSAR